MSQRRHQLLTELFTRARTLPQEQWPAFLDEHCFEDPQLRRDLENLLEEECSADNILEPSRVQKALGEAAQSIVANLPYDTIGPYRLIKKLGEGGMGEVYEAEQTEPVRRRVAIKIIKRGMDTKQVVARFEVERQALAMMDHPSVARVLDAGATPEGRPYFVMELVHGLPIVKFCDRHRLSTEQRLELFCQACEGVQHAHQKAIIHRDLKSSNILITERDGVRMPKIIDFGVAKAIAHRLTDKTMLTEFGVMVGTPEYMSPEQAMADAADVDTRADVYSMGVILYELLAGALPIDSKELRQAGLDGIREKILNVEPARPSARLSVPGADATTSAEHRRTTVPALRRELEGDLDWITMRALEKDRARRYGSPAELADDIRRHLDDQPVLAGPPSATYRARKFARRHRAGVAVAGAAALVTIAFAVTMGIQAHRIAAERDRAEFEADIARASTEFVTDMLGAPNPWGDGAGTELARTVRVVDVLDQAGEKIETTFDGKPEVEATIRATLGQTYRRLGDYEKAVSQIERALGLRRTTMGACHRDTLDLMDALAILYSNLERYDEAEALLDTVLDGSCPAAGPDDPLTLGAMSNLAQLYKKQGRYQQAFDVSLRLLETRRRLQGDEHEDTATAMSILADSYDALGRYEESEALDVECLTVRRRVLGNEHPHTVSAINNLAVSYRHSGRHEDALALMDEAMATTVRVLGEDHPVTLKLMTNLSRDYQALERYDEAEAVLSKALPLHERVFGEEHRDTISVTDEIAKLYGRLGRAEDSERLHIRALTLSRSGLGPEHPHTLVYVHNLAMQYFRAERHVEAEGLFLEAVTTQKKLHGDRHATYLVMTHNFARNHAAMGHHDIAERLFLESIAGARENGSWHAGLFLGNYGMSLARQGRFVEAEALLLEGHEILQRELGDTPQARRLADQLEEFRELRNGG